MAEHRHADGAGRDRERHAHHLHERVALEPDGLDVGDDRQDEGTGRARERPGREPDYR